MRADPPAVGSAYVVLIRSSLRTTDRPLPLAPRRCQPREERTCTSNNADVHSASYRGQNEQPPQETEHVHASVDAKDVAQSNIRCSHAQERSCGQAEERQERKEIADSTIKKP